MATQSTPYKPIVPLPEFSGILRSEETFAGADQDATSDRINGWFDRLMIQAGMEVSPTVLLMLCLLSTLIAGGLIFVIAENLLSTAFAAAVGFGLPVLWAVIARGRRQKLMMDQLPPMIDELARAAKTGRSLNQCFELVADDTPVPLGDELRWCTRKLRMGIDLGHALANLPDRTGLVTLNIFVTALSVHQQTGGDLVRVLERLSHTIRDRLLFIGRLRAATIASRATAVLMTVVPPAVVTFFSIRDERYMPELIGSSWGRAVILFAVSLQVLGVIWVLRILKQSQRG